MLPIDIQRHTPCSKNLLAGSPVYVNFLCSLTVATEEERMMLNAIKFLLGIKQHTPAQADTFTSKSYSLCSPAWKKRKEKVPLSITVMGKDDMRHTIVWEHPLAFTKRLGVARIGGKINFPSRSGQDCRCQLEFLYHKEKKGERKGGRGGT